MKPLITALGITVLLAAVGTAHAGTSFIWDGDGANADWSNVNNWTANSLYPDFWGDCADSATIASMTTYWPELDADYCITSLSMSNGTFSTSSPTQIDTDDGTARTLTVSNAFTVGGTSAETYVEQLGSGEIDCSSMTIDASSADADNENARFQLSAGTLDPGALYLDGGSSSLRKAIFDYDAGTLTNPDSIRMRSNSDIDAEASMTSAGALTADTDGRATVAVVDMADLQTFTTDSLTISVPDAATSYNSALTLQGAGEYVITNAVTLNGTTQANVEPSLTVSSTGDNAVTCGSLDLNGGGSTSQEAVLAISKSVTVGNSGTTMAGYVNMNVAASQTLDLDDIAVDGSSTVLTLVTSGTCQSDSLTIDSNAAASPEARSFQKTGAGTLDVNGALTVRGDADADYDATLQLSTGSITPDSMVLDGSTNSNYGYAILNLDQSLTVGNSGTSMAGYIDIDVADGTTFSTGPVSVTGPSANVSVVTNSTGVMTASTFTVDADAANASQTFTKVGAGSLTVSTSTTMRGDDDNGDYTATFTLSAGTFDPAALYLFGGDTSARKAIFDYNAGTLTNPDSITMRSYSDIDAEASMTSDGALTVDTDGRATAAVVDMADLQTFTTDSLTISVPDAATSYNSALTLQGEGEYVITNAVTLNGTSQANVEPSLTVSSTGDNAVTCGSLDLNGGGSTSQEAVLAINKSLTVGDSGTTMAGYVNIDVAASQTLDLDDIAVDGSSTVLTLVTSGTCQGDTLTIDAATPNASRALTKAGAGTLTVTTSTTLTGDNDSGNYPATFTLSAGTFDPAVLYLYGGNTSARKSIFDYDAGTLTNPDSMTMQGYSSVDAEASMTLAGQLTVDAGSYATSANIDMASTTTFTAPSIAVGDDTYACTLSFTSAGTGANRSKLVTN